MELIHVGLGASSEERADRFYVGVLGLEKSEPKTLDRTLGQALFGIEGELRMINYRGAQLHFEIFVVQEYAAPRKQVAHACLKVTDLAAFVHTCRVAGVQVLEVPKGSGLITFVSDFDGNLFEMKE